MLKVLTLLGTRPEIIKLSRVIPLMDRHFNHIIAHTGQNFDYELNEVFFSDLQIRKPDHFFNAAGETATKTIASIMCSMEKLLLEQRPDALLVYGDTNSCLGAIVAKRYKVPIFHCEAGNRCFDQRVPEEINRKIIDHISDINLVLSEHARRYLLAEGIRPETVIKTGSHLHEVFDHFKSEIKNSDILRKLGLQEDRYFLVSAHREENVDEEKKLRSLVQCLNSLANNYGFPIIVSTHPRTKKRLQQFIPSAYHKLVNFCTPFGFFDYNKLQMGAHCVFSDSGTLAEEAAILRLKAVAVREAHERPEGMDSNCFVMSEFEVGSLTRAVQLARENASIPYDMTLKMEGNLRCSQQIVNVIHSYIPYVNRTVWANSSAGY